MFGMTLNTRSLYFACTLWKDCLVDGKSTNRLCRGCVIKTDWEGMVHMVAVTFNVICHFDGIISEQW